VLREDLLALVALIVVVIHGRRLGLRRVELGALGHRSLLGLRRGWRDTDG